VKVPKDAFRREVALRLKEARREQTLTQRQLADLGLSTQQNISRYEKGFIPDSWFLLARLHSEKAIDLNWLLGASAISAAAQAGNGAGASGDDLPAEVIEAVRMGEAAGVATSTLEIVGARASAAPPPEPAVIADDLERGGQL
jgi:transcriptional regulator with XRE-family HTH domain